MNLGVKNKHYLIAAGSKGLGRAVAEVLCAEGAHVCIGSREEKHVSDTVEALNALDGHGSAIGCVLDAGNADSIRRWYEFGNDQWGRVDGLLVNAGGPPPGGFDVFEEQDWQQAFELTLMSAVRMIRLVLPGMKERRSGSILTVTSMTVKEPVPGMLLSNVMRSGVTSLVKSIASECGPLGIRVNNLMPGRIFTDRIVQLEEAIATRTGKSIAEIRAEAEGAIPLGRAGDPSEFGRAGAFLLSDAASYINGASLAVDGGLIKTVW